MLLAFVPVFKWVYKTKLGYDDALDGIGVHLVGGLSGSLLLGLLADPDYVASTCGDLLEGYDGPFMEGLLLGGGPALLIEQLIANGVTIVSSFGVTALIMMALEATIGVRMSEEVEEQGVEAI